MIGSMPHKLPRFIHHEINRHGIPHWYFRRGHGPRIRLPDEYGTVEWFAAYDKALGGSRERKPRYAAGSFAWGLAAYYKSQAWSALSPATQRQRRNVFKHIEAQHGGTLLAQWTRREIAAGRDKRADRPAAAGMFLKAMRGLFQWLLDAEHITSDPTQSVKMVESRTDGFESWTIEDLAAYRAHWPLGTRQRVAVEVIFAGGFRRGDAVRVGRQHVRDGVIRIDTEKTGERVIVTVSDALDAALKAGRVGDLAFIVSAEGKPYVKESFGNNFRDWCAAAGIAKSAHGLRKLAATLDAEAGYTAAELGAKYGWADLKMPSLYTRAADRERLSLNAAERVKKQGKRANKKSRT
jgi:site-specific recombinase XerD